MYQLLPGQIVILLPTLALGVGSVEPDFRHGAVFSEQFEELVKEIFVVIIDLEGKAARVCKRTAGGLAGDGAQACLAAVAVQAVRRLHLVEVRRRQVEAEFEPVLAARRGKFLYDVSLEGRRGHSVLRVAAGPENETVVVLCSEYDSLHAGVRKDAAPLVRVYALQVEDGRVFQPASPLHAAESIGAEVHESGKAVVERMQLPGGGNDTHRLGEDTGVRISLSNGNSAGGRAGASGCERGQDQERDSLAHTANIVIFVRT